MLSLLWALGWTQGDVTTGGYIQKARTNCPAEHQRAVGPSLRGEALMCGICPFPRCSCSQHHRCH